MWSEGPPAVVIRQCSLCLVSKAISSTHILWQSTVYPSVTEDLPGGSSLISVILELSDRHLEEYKLEITELSLQNVSDKKDCMSSLFNPWNSRTAQKWSFLTRTLHALIKIYLLSVIKIITPQKYFYSLKYFYTLNRYNFTWYQFLNVKKWCSLNLFYYWKSLTKFHVIFHPKICISFNIKINIKPQFSFWLEKERKNQVSPCLALIIRFFAIGYSPMLMNFINSTLKYFYARRYEGEEKNKCMEPFSPLFRLLLWWRCGET